MQRTTSFLTLVFAALNLRLILNVQCVSLEQSDATRKLMNRTIDGNIPRTICKSNACLPKCCVESEMLSVNGSCREMGNSNLHFISKIPIFRKSRNGSLERVSNLAKDHFTVIQGMPCPSGSRYQLDNLRDKFSILETGSLFDIGGNIESAIDNFCIDYLEHSSTLVSLVCFPPDDTAAVTFRYYPIGMLLSVVFLSATFLVYSLLPQLRNLHGLSLMCHVMSLTIGYLFLAVIQLATSVISLRICKLLAYTVVFSFLASFFWLNVMCFDIWWVFSVIGRGQKVADRIVDSKKFMFYSIYSWGCPTILLIIIITMESPYVPYDFFLIKPGFGVNKCWFQNKMATWTYFYAPVALILLCNLYFFLMTSLKILRISIETRILYHRGNKRHEEKETQRFVLYLKLFLVMGMTWLAEVISFHYNQTKELNYFWNITDMSNTLQGIPIFFIFVWKWKTLKLLNEKLCPSFQLISKPSTELRDLELRNNNNNNNYTNMKNKQTVSSVTTDEKIQIYSIKL